MKLQKTLWVLLLIIVSIATNVFAADSPGYSFTDELSYAASRLKSEGADFVRTPFQFENGNIFYTIGAAAIVTGAYTLDTDIRKRVNGTSSKGLDKFTDAGSLIGDPFLHLGISALVYGGGVAAGSAKYREIGEMMGEAAILADAATLVIKETAGRGRPVATDRKSDFRAFGFKNNYDSFPSMHTASSFAMASVLSATSESVVAKIGYYAAASCVAFSRVYQEKHWASDVILGAAIGELSGRVVTAFHVNKSKVSFAPTILENGGGLAMVGKW